VTALPALNVGAGKKDSEEGVSLQFKYVDGCGMLGTRGGWGPWGLAGVGVGAWAGNDTLCRGQREA